MKGLSKAKKVLLLIAAFELLAIIGILIWVAFFYSPSAGAPNNQATARSDTLNTPHITAAAYATGFTNPVAITAPQSSTDERLFVVEQAGAIKAIGKDGKKVSAPFLDITSRVLSGGEKGLLGLTFDPAYAKNGFFYVNYIDKNLNTIIARFTASAQTGVADPASEKLILTVKQPYENHNGGALAFGPDGYLYIALGDGGNGGDPENRAQNKNELLGKLLRIDVHTTAPYVVPQTNPFFGQVNVRPEIWALGLRNPWKISFDRLNGNLFIADVGQGDIEEVNMQPKASKGGENYGWRCYEGTKEYNTNGCEKESSYIKPNVTEYNHSDERCSVTGGAAYRGTAEPALQGKYFYADYCGGQLYYATPPANQSDKEWPQTLVTKTPYKISAFGEDKNGELYFADLASGTIYKLSDTAN